MSTKRKTYISRRKREAMKIARLLANEPVREIVHLRRYRNGADEPHTRCGLPLSTNWTLNSDLATCKRCTRGFTFYDGEARAKLLEQLRRGAIK